MITVCGSHKISYIFFRKLGKMLQNLSSAAVVIGALKVKQVYIRVIERKSVAKNSSVIIYRKCNLYQRRRI